MLLLEAAAPTLKTTDLLYGICEIYLDSGEVNNFMLGDVFIFLCVSAKFYCEFSV